MSGTTGNTNVMPFAKLHAPKTFSDLVFADPLVAQRLALYAANQVHNSLILHGPFGTAKSTTALTIVHDRRMLCGDHGPYVHRYLGSVLGQNLNALEGSINLMLASENDRRPYVVIDEADQMPKARQLELRDLLDSYSSIRVIMTTNSISQIDGGLCSRCERLHIAVPQPSAWLRRAQSILASEGVRVPAQVLAQLLATTSDMRDVMRELEMVVLNQRGSPPMANTAPALSVLPGNVQVTSSPGVISSPVQLTVLPQSGTPSP